MNFIVILAVCFAFLLSTASAMNRTVTPTMPPLTTAAPDVDSVVRGIGYSIAAVGGVTVAASIVVLVVCAHKKRVAAKAADGSGAYSQI